MEFVEYDKNKMTLDVATKVVASKLDTDDHIKVKTWSLSDETEKMLDMILDKILYKYNRFGYKPALYAVIKELAINATKANLKTLFFEEHGYDLNDPNHYDEAISKYKEQLSENFALTYGKKSKERGKFVRITFDHSTTGLTLLVENNTPISQIDAKRIQEKLEKARQYDDLAQFYMDEGDATEGAGIGFALIVILLKGVGIDPERLNIKEENGSTLACLTIQF